MVDVTRLGFESDTSGLVKAEKALDGVEKQSRQTEKATDQLARSFDHMGASGARSAKNAGNMGRSLSKTFSGRTQSQIQNASFQLQDIAVQLEMGTDASRVMAQQLPQLLGGFGALGAALGVVVGVGLPLAAMFLDSGDAAQDAEGKVEDYKDALDGLKGISKELAVEQAKLAGTFSDMRIFDAERQLKQLQTTYQELAKAGEGAPGLLSVLFGAESDREEVFSQLTSIQSALAKAVQEQEKLDRIEYLEDLAEDAQDLIDKYDPLTKITREYAENKKLINDALREEQISAQAASAALALMKQEYQEQIDPLQTTLDALKEERELLKMADDERRVEIQLRKEVDAIRKAGVSLSQFEIANLREQIRLNQQLKAQNNQEDPLQKAFENIQSQTTGQLQNITYQIQALNMAMQQGMITGEGYTTRLMDLNMQAAQLRMSLGDGTFADAALASLEPLMAGYEGALSSISDSFGNTFNSLADGFADSIGQAIVYSDNLGDSLRDVARSAVAELISSLVKIGIQYVVNAALGQSMAAASAASSAAMAGGLAAAWAPAAALASLASFGTNAGPAMAGITATMGLTQGLAAVGSGLGGAISGGGAVSTPVATLADGGFVTGPGGPRTDSIPAMLSNGEFVVNAAATRQNRPMLEAMNSGKTMKGGGVNVTIQNMAGVDMDVQQLSETDVVIIARRTAKQVVREDAPSVISADLTNPNSRTSRALTSNTNTQRKR